MIYNYKDLKVGVLGLGYVGLPLSLEFGKKRKIIGFDINKNRVKELKSGFDRNYEYSKKQIQSAKKLSFTSNETDLKNVNCFIITVPTPINRFKKPNLNLLFKASKIVSDVLKKGDLVIYESTVYPGCIEEDCVPILEKSSGLIFNKEFFCGYSPERINPGDKTRDISSIKKITSGSTFKVTEIVDKLYNEIITVGTHKVSSIKIAEAAKIIENTQRDLNIALINELSILFSKMEIDTESVLEAAETKWNFISFRPGLVGGHCIGVDPYYLTHRAEKIGYRTKIILSGRKLNDGMGAYVASNLINHLRKKNKNISKSKILIMGLTFKENCADIRNSGVENIILELKKHKCKLNLFDPWVDKKEIKIAYDINPIFELKKNVYDGIIIAVAHNIFKKMGIKSIKSLCKKNHIIYDLKYLFPKNKTDLRL